MIGLYQYPKGQVARWLAVLGAPVEYEIEGGNSNGIRVFLYGRHGQLPRVASCQGHFSLHSASNNMPGQFFLSIFFFDKMWISIATFAGSGHPLFGAGVSALLTYSRGILWTLPACWSVWGCKLWRFSPREPNRLGPLLDGILLGRLRVVHELACTAKQ